MSLAETLRHLPRRPGPRELIVAGAITPRPSWQPRGHGQRTRQGRDPWRTRCYNFEAGSRSLIRS
jgi:hypothetical protein